MKFLPPLLTAFLLLHLTGPLPAQEKNSAPIVVPAQKHAGDNAQAVAFSPDGKYVAAAFGGPTNGRFPLQPRGGGIAIWETATGKQLHFVGEYGDFLRLAFSADGKALAYARIWTPGDSIDDDVVVVLDVATGQVRKRWNRFQSGPAFLMSRSTNTILVGQELYDLKDFRKLKTLPVLAPRCLAAAADGKSLAAVHTVKSLIVRLDGTVSKGVHALAIKGLAIFDAAKLDQRRGIETSTLVDCFAAALSPEAKWLATGHSTGVVRLWDGATLGEAARIDTGFRGHVLPFFAPDGKTLALATQPANDPQWEYGKTKPGDFPIRRDKPGTGCEVIVLEPAGLKEAAYWQFQDGSFRTYYARQGRNQLHPEYNPERFQFSPDGRYLLAGCNGVVLLETASGRIVRQFVVQKQERP